MADRKRTPSETYFAQLLFDESPDALISVTIEGRIRSWNRGASEMFGYDALEAIGKAIHELTVPEEGRDGARRALDEAVQQGSTLLETIRRRKDGSLVNVDVSMRRVDTPGGETFIAVSKKSVVQRRRLQELEASEAKFRSLLEAAPVEGGVRVEVVGDVLPELLFLLPLAGLRLLLVPLHGRSHHQR